MVSTGIKTAAPHLILTNATKQYSFPRGLCLLSLPSILIRNWNHCWRQVVSTFSMEYRTQDHLEGQRRQPWPLSISFGMTLGHPTKGASVAPRVCGRPPICGDTLEPFPQPHTQVLPLHPSAVPLLQRHILEAEIGYACLTTCPLSYLWHQEGCLFLSLSFLVFSLLLLSALSSFIQILKTLINCPLCIRLLGRDFNMISQPMQACAFHFHSIDKEPGQKRAFSTTLRKISLQALSLRTHFSFLIHHCQTLSGLSVCILPALLL